MEKMIFRMRNCFWFSLNFTNELRGRRKFPYSSLKDIADGKGLEYVIEEICEDNVPYNVLCEEFERFLKEGSSEYFAYAYRLNEKYAISTEPNLYLYRFSPEDILEQKAALKWLYAPTMKFVGDPWWYEDDEIISDIQHMSLLDFFDKYKGYDG